VQVGRSVEGEPLTLHLFGTGPHPTLVIGGIHGDEPTGADVAERLVALLRAFPDARGGATVAVLPRANPDGLARRTRKNANGVDLNRNLPAANWRQRSPGRWDYGGPKPASEPETRAILRTIEMLRPARIVAIHAIKAGRKCNNYDGPAEDLAHRMAGANGYPVVASLGPCYGSLGNWAGVDRHIPILTLELPREQAGREAWQDNRDALVAVIRNGQVSSQTPPVAGR
ncbi:MAG TPA: M14 family zinc carboxypeptidase, partial [Phycisphaerae bacterium]|nr:M14 family zinc carboxypeptidase [Phycisphaerae bacterium]